MAQYLIQLKRSGDHGDGQTAKRHTRPAAYSVGYKLAYNTLKAFALLDTVQGHRVADAINSDKTKPLAVNSARAYVIGNTGYTLRIERIK